jgi:putative endonuclease
MDQQWAISPICVTQCSTVTIIIMIQSVMRQYYVYILTNKRKTVLYTGVTSNLIRRVWQHKRGEGSEFTSRYHCSLLVFYEVFHDSYNAITREKQIKAGSRRRKLELIELVNPEWRDLTDQL